VAVVSISRIQIRRGQKNQGSGLPQLASGELGWAIDTRELFIGNGAVSEGAPAVGNSKILTEYDDIFSLADTYEYRTNDGYLLTGPDSGSPVTRSLQDRLDDTVSVRAFGAKGDGIADDTASIQRAIDQLYLNSATKLNPSSRIVLRLEAGVYNISSSLFVPPYATSHTTISNSLFENITWNGIAVINGKYNLSSNNRFFVVGTMAGTEQNPVHPVILYKNPTNKSTLDYFARTEALISGPNLLTIPYVPEIDGTAMYTLDYEHVQNFGALNNTRLFRLPGVQNQSYELDYTITSNTYRVIRSGVITVIVDAVQNNVEVSDDYDFVGDDTFLDTLDFTAQLRDADNDTEADTIDVRLTSGMPNDDDSVIRFTIKAKKTDTP